MLVGLFEALAWKASSRTPRTMGSSYPDIQPARSNALIDNKSIVTKSIPATLRFGHLVPSVFK